MAIQGSITYKGITANNAYVRIEDVHGGHMHDWKGTVRLYYDKDSADVPGSINALDMSEVTAVYVANTSPYPDLYAALKNDPKYSSFIDV